MPTPQFNIVLSLDDTAQALGLRYLLDRYFDINATIAMAPDELESGDTVSTLYIVTPKAHSQALDFFIPRRSRTVIAGSSQLSLDLSESEIAEQLHSIIKQHDNSSTERQAGLSQREIEVLRLVAMGLINKEIADKLNISFNTVLSHRKNITSKLGIRSVSGLSVYAMMNGYVNESDLKI